MQTQTRKPLRAEAVMAIIAAIIALVLGVITWLSWPYITAEPAPAPTQPVTQPTTEPTTVPTEPPTEPTEPPELNPYGKLDFQYEGDYLKCLRTETVPGIDVSAFQGEVDWERVAASGIKFAFVRLGYRGYGKAGTLVEDEYARRNLEGARAAGLEVGVYFFSQAVNTQEVKEEVDFMMQIMGDFQPDLPVVFDWEYISDTARTANMDRRTLTDCALEFGRLIEEKGFEPMIYFNPNQSRRLLYLKELEKYPFWLAFYTDRMTYPYKVDYWQYTCTGRVPGIQGDVDINIRFYD
jgi:GH25 family lysozyme M1 (1,4-beta-N-acetylmuramidase)